MLDTYCNTNAKEVCKIKVQISEIEKKIEKLKEIRKSSH
jgi:hypothetical protein